MTERFICHHCKSKYDLSATLKHHLTECDKKDEKKNLGQFFTTNYKYILKNMYIPNGVTQIIEPFTGNGDLLNFIDISKYNLESYDIDPKKEYTIRRDTLLNPPAYNNKFILTNPPYLARNKSFEKSIYDKYDVNDLYKCFIKELTNNKCIGGIIIIPLNFWCSIRKNEIQLRKSFLEVYNILLINVFEEQVFNDTTYTVCSFQFELRKSENNNYKVDIYPSNKKMTITMSDENNYRIGGEIYNLSYSTHKISRLTSKNISKKNTNLVLKCIDDNANSLVRIDYVEDNDIFVDNTPKQSARAMATLIIEPKISKKKQKELSKQFNEFMKKNRETYHSLFLTNYRESKDIARKRISFDLAYTIAGYLLER